jgi:hypothetical protein
MRWLRRYLATRKLSYGALGAVAREEEEPEMGGSHDGVKVDTANLSVCCSSVLCGSSVVGDICVICLSRSCVFQLCRLAANRGHLCLEPADLRLPSRLKYFQVAPANLASGGRRHRQLSHGRGATPESVIFPSSLLFRHRYMSLRSLVSALPFRSRTMATAAVARIPVSIEVSPPRAFPTRPLSNP